MDRMSFIPGKPHREFFHNANGHIFFGRACALDFADTFLLPYGHNILYQLVLACLSEGDQVDIWFGARNPCDSERIDPDGEPVGHTWATLTDATSKQKHTLWDVSRDTPLLTRRYATRAFNAYRQALALYQGVDKPTPIPIPPSSTAEEASPGSWTMSRCFSPANLYECASVIWYFIDLSQQPSPTSSPDAMVLSIPMPAQDAIILATLLTIVLGAPPVCFAVYQSGQLGCMPSSFQHAGFADAKAVTSIKAPEIAIIC